MDISASATVLLTLLLALPYYCRITAGVTYSIMDIKKIPVGTRFSAPVQTGPGAHPASCTVGTGSFPG